MRSLFQSFSAFILLHVGEFIWHQNRHQNAGSEHWMSIKPKWNFLELLTVIVNVAIFTTKPELQVKRHGQQLSRVQYQEQIRSLCQYVQRGSEWFQRHKTDPASPTMKEVHELTRIYSIGAWAELWNSRTALGCIFWRYSFTRELECILVPPPSISGFSFDLPSHVKSKLNLKINLKSN